MLKLVIAAIIIVVRAENALNESHGSGDIQDTWESLNFTSSGDQYITTEEDTAGTTWPPDSTSSGDQYITTEEDPLGTTWPPDFTSSGDQYITTEEDTAGTTWPPDSTSSGDQYITTEEDSLGTTWQPDFTSSGDQYITTEEDTLWTTSPSAGTHPNTTTPETFENTTATRTPENTTATRTPENTTATRAHENTTATRTPENTTATRTPESTTATRTPENTTATRTHENITTTRTSENSTTSLRYQITTTPGTHANTTTIGTTLSVTTTAVAPNQQRDLYPWGVDANDQVISDQYWGQLVYFTGGIPFGNQKFTEARVFSNGVISFGTSFWWMGWPNFNYAFGIRANILAPFWFSWNYRQTGKVYYQLYESKDSSNHSPLYHKHVLERASNEVKEFYGVQHFKAQVVLVATWENVEPDSWYTWLCEYYKYYHNQWWWYTYYSSFYEQYCINQRKETDTFQAVYATDGQEAHAIVTYKFGGMKWKYEMWRDIAVGFITPDNVIDYGVSYTDLTTKMDKIKWNTGRYGTWIERVGKIENTDSRCMNFYAENLHLVSNPTHKAFAAALFDCPCSMDYNRMGRQWWTYSSDLIPGTERSYRVCYAIGVTAKVRLEKLRGNPLNKLCCYILTYPSYSDWYWNAWSEAYSKASYIHFYDSKAGHLLLNDPWYQSGNARKSREEDFIPHRWCCENSSSPSKLCSYFNIVRPDYGCSPNAEYITGAALGDPHIKTLDNKDYTLNGLGEYIIMYIDEVEFMLQGRTQQALNSEGNKTSATVFVAFAAREGSNVSFQVELDSAQTGMVISACGVDITRDFYKDANFKDTQCDNNIDVNRGENNDLIRVIASFSCGVSVEVYVGMKNLEFSTNVPKTFKGKTRGLLGNFNDNPNDDFVLPDETVLTANQTDTERKIFTNFGKEWEVTTGNSVFKYPEGESALDYQFPTFEPIFREDVNQTVLNEAVKLCGGEEKAACIFDYIATRDEKFATNTGNKSKEANRVATSQKNNLPVLSLAPDQLNSKQQWEVTHGQQASIIFNATDADVDDEITYLLRESSQNVVINDSGVVNYTPDSANSVVIGVQAKDSKGGLSSVISLNIAVCPTCNSHGVCNKNRTREQEKEGGKFVVFVCKCQPAYTGDDCEQEVDACAASPCSRGQNCTDLSAAEQGDSEVGHICGECPSGFTKLITVCADINECIENGTGSVCPQNSVCTNSVGSYMCTCDLGFRQNPVNSSHCKDVDECAERTHKCDHICQNNEGNYSCSCFDGNTLNSDGKTCTAVNSAACSGCKQVCIMTNGNASCGCKNGYQLSGTTDCIDIDECKSANKPCSQACQNTEGSFVCSCYNGYKLDEDSVSCTACDQPYYGQNCSSICVCNGRGTCSNIRGCQCKKEWTGANCIQDVDECTTNITACPGGQICTNTFGSYSCSCPEGYILSNGLCEDFNECGDVLDHNCSLSVEDCINNKGSYSCRCRTGYSRNADGVCEDIDECATNSHDCEQMCENTPGRYNCKCYYGYKLDIDRANCVKRDTDVCAGVTNLVCDHVCTVDLATNTPYCMCNSGYSLSNKEKCLDINECQAHLNLCEYKNRCSNTEGGYNCTCPLGSMLDNDGRSCVVCSGGKWGMNCVEDCACGLGTSYCDPKIGCVCKSGYTGTFCEVDINECSRGILVCQTGETCVNKPGSDSCDCQVGYTKTGSSCQDINECASVISNDCDQVCSNYGGGYSCSCNVGYQFNPADDLCQDIDECTLKLDNCEQICENTNGGYRCSCSDGLKLHLDGVKCVEVSQCVSKSCDEKCAVVNGKETCFCSKGKVLDSANDSRCVDVDMCKNNPCSNPNGCNITSDGTGFVCTCPDGQKLASDGFTCVDCIEETFGRNCSQKCACSTATTQSCRKTDGVCSCKTGFNSATCSVDINECSSSSTSCPAFSDCANTPGSYVCKCKNGYYFVNNTCQNCSANTYGQECSNKCTCDMSHSKCDSITGKCVCQVGWTGVNCDTDVDECSGGDKCATPHIEHWICLNIAGSYTCGCKPGYVLNTYSNNCVDFDECAASYSNQCEQNCTNTVGSYLCSCNRGYQLGSDGHKCEDIDECRQVSDICQQMCNNQVGGYHCSCQEGYQISADNGSLCYEALTVISELSIPMNVKELNLREHQGRDYLRLKAAVETALRDEIKKTVNGVTAVLVTQMRKDLIVDFTTIIDKAANPSPASDMVEALNLLSKNGITINETHYSAAAKVGAFTANATTDKCIILQTIEPCRDGEECVKDAAGKVSCQKPSDKSSVNVPLVVGLSVGLPLAVALIIAVAVALGYKKKLNAQKRIDNREDTYSERIWTPSPKFLSYFSAGPYDSYKPTGKANDKYNVFM